MLTAFQKRCGYAMAFIATMVMPAIVQAQVTLPSTGIDVEDYVTALVTALGAAVAAAIGAWFAFLALRKGLAWVRRVG
jgi:hypothetical protein